MVRFKSAQVTYSTNKDLVSIPLWFDSNFADLNELYKIEIVSIPLWFDSNRSGDRESPDKIESQFHYGSIQINFLPN